MAIKQSHEKNLFVCFFLSTEIIRQVRKILLDEVQRYSGHLPKFAYVSAWGMCVNVCACKLVHIFLISHVSTLKLNCNLTNFWQLHCCWVSVVCVCVLVLVMFFEVLIQAFLACTLLCLPLRNQLKIKSRFTRFDLNVSWIFFYYIKLLNRNVNSHCAELISCNSMLLSEYLRSKTLNFDDKTPQTDRK